MQSLAGVCGSDKVLPNLPGFLFLYLNPEQRPIPHHYSLSVTQNTPRLWNNAQASYTDSSVIGFHVSSMFTSLSDSHTGGGSSPNDDLQRPAWSPQLPLSLPSSLTPLCAGPQTCQAHCCLRAFALTVFSAWNWPPTYLNGSFSHPLWLSAWKIMISCPTLLAFAVLFVFIALFTLHQVLHLQFDLLPTYLPSLECKPHEDRGFVIACHVFKAGTLHGA